MSDVLIPAIGNAGNWHTLIPDSSMLRRGRGDIRHPNLSVLAPEALFLCVALEIHRWVGTKKDTREEESERGKGN